MSRVWILGAGFSRALGAPLLSDLFSLRKRTVFMSVYPTLFGIENQAIHQAYALFHHGMNYPEGYLFEPNFATPRGTKLWRDAENFIEELDDAAHIEAHRKELEEMWDTFRAASDVALIIAGTQRKFQCQTSTVAKTALADSTSLGIAAKQIVAAECHHFLTSVTQSSERAKPFVAWGRCLDKDDTIVTFNYDLVVEKIVNTSTCVAGVTAGNAHQDAQDALNKNVPLLIKLHGSLDWMARKGDPSGAFPCLKATPNLSSDYAPAIATPGASKLAARDGAFKDLWDTAASKIRQATEIYIVGYGLPESDASAREFLLENIRDNEVIGKSSDLKISIVLGDIDFRARRLDKLLQLLPSRRKHVRTIQGFGGDLAAQIRAATNFPPYTPELLPMYAQDFLAKYATEQTG